MKSAKEEGGDSWSKAILEATAFLLEQQRNQERDTTAHASLQRLVQLSSLLQPLRAQWDAPPPFSPPPVMSNPLGLEAFTPPATAFANTSLEPPHAASDTTAQAPQYLQNNPYAGIYQDDDDEDEAGDHPVWNPEAEATPTTFTVETTTTGVLNMRRLLIRIWTSTSDVHGWLASDCRRKADWTTGANHCFIAVEIMPQAMALADAEISRCWNQVQKMAQQQHEKGHTAIQALCDDADICHVAMQHLHDEKDAFLAQAAKRTAKLTAKLQPAWESRDAVKAKMGAERWKSNPNPKFDHAALRRDMEEELERAQAAMQTLQGLDTGALVESARALQQRLRGKGDINVASNEKQRYNGKRPTDTTQRVPSESYPDPTMFGWTFTGSGPHVEFFELQAATNGSSDSDIVKLDWYFTTSTVKTSLDHPRQGKTQLFAAQVSPDTYVDILLDPRAHTGQRYHTKPKKTNSNTRGRGRGQRGN